MHSDIIQNSRNAFVSFVFVTGIWSVYARPESRANLFPLSIIHINDFHARFEPTDTAGGACNVDEECIGGYARTVDTVRKLLEEQKHNNAIYLNAGDNFQGTLWYNVGRWNVTSQFLNMLPADAMTLGNHEFDHGVMGVVPFLETLNTPILVANIDDSDEPDIQGKYQKSMIIERNKRKIGIIGVIIETTYDLANTGKLKFRNESESILEEAAKLKTQGANIIIVLSHCGYDVDKIIAERTGSEIDVIVGSHSHTFLYTGDTPPGPDKPRGDYPTIVDHSSGHRVLIVQAGAYGKYVGNITVFFDMEGILRDFEGSPLYMANSVPEDTNILKAMRPWKTFIDIKGTKVFGKSLVELSKRNCDSQECNIGDFVCDAMLNAFRHLERAINPSKNVSIALINNRAIKSSIHKGNITYSQLIAMAPYENTLVAFDLPGEQLRLALELAVEAIDVDKGLNSSYTFLQVSGLKVSYDFHKPINQRIVDLQIRCPDCAPPRYEPFNPATSYRIVTPTFLQTGGNGYTMFQNMAPIYNPEILQAIPEWRDIVNAQGNVKIGSTLVNLTHSVCGYQECNMGNFYTDAILDKLQQLTSFNNTEWTNVSIALVAAGELYETWNKGDITYKQIYSQTPFEAPLVAFDLEGKYFKEALENSVQYFDIPNNITASNSFLQVGGIKITYNLSKPIYERVQEVKVQCALCEIPDYDVINETAVYRILATRFVSNGGYGFSEFREYGKNKVEYFTDFASLQEYVEKMSPIFTGLEGRITIH